MSRYRYEIHLNADSSGSQLILAPNDAHYMEEAIWSFDDTRQLLYINGTSQSKTYEVIIIEKDIIILK